MPVNRRTVLKAAVASLVVPFSVSVPARRGEAADAALSAYLEIDANNVATVYVGISEMGQGTTTGLAQIVAEELQLDWTKVRVAQGEPNAYAPNPYRNPGFGMQLTGGSTAIWGWYSGLRTAAAITRDKLIAGARSQYPRLTFTVAGNGMLRASNGSLYPYSEFVATAASQNVTSATWATSRNFIGRPMRRLDLADKTDGSAVFGMDVQVPNMLFASLVHCPTIGGTVASAPTSAAGAVAVVNLDTAVGVVARDTYSAMRAARLISASIRWNLPVNPAAMTSTTIIAKARALATSTTVTPQNYENEGNAVAAYTASVRKIDQIYTTPLLAHACMEVLACTAHVEADHCELWVPTQAQEWCLGTAMAITGLAADKIKVNTTFLGGGFGRKIEQDYVSQAIKLSRAVGRPVKLMWPREQDFGQDRYRPATAMRVRMGTDANGVGKALIFRNVSTSINVQRNSTPGNNPEDRGAVAGASGLPYAFAARTVEFVDNPNGIPVGYWRSVGESYNTFAVESAVDEMALLLRKDPLALRKQLLATDSRAIGVLNALGAMSRWTSALPAGQARGMAFVKGFFSYAALAVEISLIAGQVKVNKAYYAVDCGVAINPDSIEAQLQGAFLMGLGATLWQQVPFTNGVAGVSNFDRYRVAKMSDTPVITVQVINSTQAPGGIGELGVPLVAPAIANAHARLTNRRQRSLPFYPGSGMGEIEDGDGGEGDDD